MTVLDPTFMQPWPDDIQMVIVFVHLYTAPDWGELRAQHWHMYRYSSERELRNTGSRCDHTARRYMTKEPVEMLV